MRFDDSGVGGFFEDLPVLAFVLCGTALLLMSASWSYGHIAYQQKSDELRLCAVSFVARISAELRGSGDSDFIPLISSIDRLNISELAKEELNGRHYSLAILQLYPSLEWLAKESDPGPRGSQAVAASGLSNALNNENLVVVIEVRALVW